MRRRRDTSKRLRPETDDTDSMETAEVLVLKLTALHDSLSSVSGTWAIQAQLTKCIKFLRAETYTTAGARRVGAVVSHVRFTLEQLRADPGLTRAELDAVAEASETYEVCLRLLA